PRGLTLPVRIDPDHVQMVTTVTLPSPSGGGGVFSASPSLADIDGSLHVGMDRALVGVRPWSSEGHHEGVSGLLQAGVEAAILGRYAVWIPGVLPGPLDGLSGRDGDGLRVIGAHRLRVRHDLQN